MVRLAPFSIVRELRVALPVTAEPAYGTPPKVPAMSCTLEVAAVPVVVPMIEVGLVSYSEPASGRR